MADDHVQPPPDTRPPPPGPSDAVTATPPVPPAGAPPGAPAAPDAAPAPAYFADLPRLLRWALGALVVLACGYVLIFGAGYVAYARGFDDAVITAVMLVALAASVGLFYALEAGGRVSRLVGLRVAADPTPRQRLELAAALLAALGAPLMAYMLLRSAPAEGAAAAGANTGGAKPTADVSNTREVIETVVFVVVLVLLLKSFVAEAFVIPTGSMATTLYGYQKDVICPKCGHEFPVNCSQEVDPQEGHFEVVRSCACPNCRWPIELAELKRVVKRDPRNGQQEVEEVWVPDEKYAAHTGDRVLVGKFLYDLPWRAPRRLDVVVFKYPDTPQKDYTPLNYIKRLVGRPGEALAIYYGKLFVLPAGTERALHFDDRDVDPLDLWRYKYMHVDDPLALKKFEDGEFEILRRPPEVLLAMRRLVYDNDHPASDLTDTPRWVAGGSAAWKEDAKARTFAHAAADDKGLAWLRYRHLLVRDGRDKPQLITDFMGYNSGAVGGPGNGQPTQHWVGDLMLECEVKVEKAEGQFVMELSRGSNRFRAVFDLAGGDCTLRRVEGHKGKEAPADDAGKVLATKPTDLKKPGTYKVRFANVDDRLVVWVGDRGLPFGEDGVPYDADRHDRGPWPNDLEPAAVAARGAGVTVGRLQLWRDTYYTRMTPQGDDYPHLEDKELADPDALGPLRRLEPETLYVQPGHYLCMGDNSPHSSDSRAWGLVPERLMLGRALVVYYPFYAPVWPLNNPVNRVRAIH